MRIAITLLAFTSLILFSCQKERDFANQSNGGSGTTLSDGLLIKTVAKSAADSLVTTYSYDANKKLIVLKRVGVDDQGNVVNTEYHFHRNAAGIVSDYSVTDPALVAAGIDSITTVIHYVSNKYSSYVINVNVPGFMLLDSSVFVYDVTGKIVGENGYQSPSGLANDYYLTGKINYSYDQNGNISAIAIHDYDQSGAETFTANTSNIIYDSKTNPIHLPNEAFALGHPEWTCVNNIVSEQLTDSNGPADDQSVTYVYTYNSNNKPATSKVTSMPDNTVGNTTFYYQ